MAGDRALSRPRGGRRVAVAVVALVLVAAGVAVAGGSIAGPMRHGGRAQPPVVEVWAGRGLVARVPVRLATRARIERLLAARLPERGQRRRGLARITVRYDAAATVVRALALGTTGGRVQAAAHPIAAVVAAPLVRQVLRNDCEAAALEILGATVGRRIDQRRLQAAFPRSGTLDPTGNGTSRMVWGDPDLGYVGRPDGGGTAGGFGIYPSPVQRTAGRFGLRLRNLTGEQPDAVYRRLLAGHAVIAWLGLAQGPYGTWTTPQRRRITVNFNEHTVVLYGIDADGTLEVSNPLEGTRERYTKQQFEAMWDRLGRRALST